MQAKDTVMSRERIEGTIGYFLESPKISDGIVEVAEQQAEISYQAGLQAGRKEVAEWIEKNSELEKCDPDVMAYFNEYRWIDEEDWQSKLKDWGIEDV